MKKLALIFLLFNFSSCNLNEIVGKIEFRQDSKDCTYDIYTTDGSEFVSSEKANIKGTSKNNSVYLSNSSTYKSYEFIIRITKKLNDTVISYSTEKKKLAPGDEVRLGCKEYFLWDEFDKKIFRDSLKNESIVVYDSTKPRKVSHFEMIYQCTGQILLNNKK